MVRFQACIAFMASDSSDMFLDDKILTVVDLTQWLVNGGLIPARTDIFFITWPIVL